MTRRNALTGELVSEERVRRLGLAVEWDTLAPFNILVQWHGIRPDKGGMFHLTIAELSL